MSLVPRVCWSMVAAAMLSVGLCACAADGPTSSPARVGYLAAATAQSPREDGVAAVTLPATMQGANLLVAVAMGDGPDTPPAQRTRLADTAGHTWTLHKHHVVFGSIIDVYTAPATGAEAGATVRSELTIQQGDEGHNLTVLAYRNGRLGSITERNGHYGLPQLAQTVPAGADVLTAFADGRQNTPTTPAPGFSPLNVLAITTGDQDLYQLNRLDPPGSWRGGSMLTGNLDPLASAYWGLVDVVVAPAT